MKKWFGVAFLAILMFGLASAADCNLDVSLLNQDPVHAVPGETVKLVFQVSGVDNSNCGTVTFKIVPDYPFSLNPGVSPISIISAGTFTQDYNSQATVPVTLRVDKDALDKSYVLKVEYSSSTKNGNAFLQKSFDISVEDVKGEFDVFVQNYVPSTKTITFGIVNVGKNDVEALTVDLLNQKNFVLQGSSKSVVGSLDANQDSSFNFQGLPKTGEINLKVSYNDKNGVRRSVDETAVFDKDSFPDTSSGSGLSFWFYVVLVIVLFFAGRWGWRKWNARKAHHHNSSHNSK